MEVKSGRPGWQRRRRRVGFWAARSRCRLRARPPAESGGTLYGGSVQCWPPARPARTMQSLVLWLVAVACACEPCLASTSGSGHQRPRNTLLALVRAALHNHPPAAHPPNLPPLPENAFGEYSRLYRRHHVAPDVAPGPLITVPQHQAEQQEDPLQEHQPEEDEREVEERRRAWSKRGQASDAPVSGGAADGQEEAMAAGLQKVGASMATNFLRHARSGPRPYDVPRIGKCLLPLFLCLTTSPPVLCPTLPTHAPSPYGNTTSPYPITLGHHYLSSNILPDHHRAAP